MKRAIFVLVLLTVGVILPPLYSQWTESQRQIQIQAVKSATGYDGIALSPADLTHTDTDLRRQRAVATRNARTHRYLDHILCRGKKFNANWEACAEKLGIDVERIQQLFDAPEAEELFRENIKRATTLGIRASPTILVDGHPFRANQLLRASGTPCE